MTPKEAYDILENNPNIKNKSDLETIICQNAHYSYFYALDIIKGKWIKGEKTICQNATYSCYYAMDVIKDRWIKGEKAISQDAKCSYYYAKYVIKGELPEFMHKKMIIHGIVNSEDAHVKDYFEFIRLPPENPVWTVPMWAEYPQANADDPCPLPSRQLSHCFCCKHHSTTV